jgi:transcription termination/antitermination protein NusA
MSLDLNAIMGQIGRDKGIDKRLLIEAVESAMLSAAKRHYGHSLNLEARFAEESGEVEVFAYRVVVDRVEDAATQMSLEEALQLAPSAVIGEEFGFRLDSKELGRISAQTAKQVIVQKLRDAEQGVIFEEYKESKGNLINGIVQRYDRGNVIVNLGRTEAILPRREQINREKYRQGDRIRAMILDIDPSNRGPQIIISRSHPEFLARLFEIEVPEIADGSIQIKSVARDPGERAKVAVYSKDDSLDPVGACVGVRGSRVLAVVQELRGEKIDIVTWTPDEPSFVARALSPAEVARVVVDEDHHSMEVIVNDDQLSLAIGRRGQNVKLASKLTGWKLDVRSVSVAEEETRRARQAIEAIPTLGITESELLFQEGYRSAKEVSEANADDIREIEGIASDRAEAIIEAARKHFEEHESNLEGDNAAKSSDTNELHSLVLDPFIRDKLIELDITSVQDLVELEEDTLRDMGFDDDDQIESIAKSVNDFLKTPKV